MKTWIDVTFGEVVVGDVIIASNGTTYRVRAVSHSDKPGGSVVLKFEGAASMRGESAEATQVWR